MKFSIYRIFVVLLFAFIIVIIPVGFFAKGMIAISVGLILEKIFSDK